MKVYIGGLPKDLGSSAYLNKSPNMFWQRYIKENVGTLWKENVGTLGDQPGILLAIHAAKCNVMCANL